MKVFLEPVCVCTCRRASLNKILEAVGSVGLAFILLMLYTCHSVLSPRLPLFVSQVDPSLHSEIIGPYAKLQKKTISKDTSQGYQTAIAETLKI